MLESAFSQRRWLMPLILFIASLLFYSSVYPLKQQNGIVHALDLNEYTYPYFDFLVREVREEHSLPLWNPYQMSGFSIIGSGEVNLFYPPNWLIYLLNVRRAVAINLILHGFIGMWGAAALSRQTGSSHLGAIAAGLLWGGSGLIGARLYAGHYTILLPLAWLPWLLSAYLATLDKGTWKSGIFGAVILGLLHLAGHPQIALISGVTLMIIWAYHLLKTPLGARFWETTRPLIVIVLLGTLLGAVDLLPVIDTALASTRNEGTEDRFAFADEYSMPANQLITFIFPKLIGGRGGYIPGDGNFEELFAYIGLLPLIALAVMVQRPLGQFWLLVLIGGLGVILSLAIDGGLLRLLIQIIPQFGLFRSAARWLMLTQLALACITGLMITQLQQASAEERQALLRRLSYGVLPKLILAVFALALIINLGRGFPEADTSPMVGNLADVIAQAGLVLLLLNIGLIAVQMSRENLQQALIMLILIGVVDVWSVSLPLIEVGGFNTYNRFWRQLESVISADETGLNRIIVQRGRYRTYNGATGRGFYDVYGYEQLTADSYAAWTRNINPLALANRLAGIRYVVRGEPYEEDDPVIKELTLLGEHPDDKLYIYTINDPVPRAFMAATVRVERATYDQFTHDYDRDNANTVIVEKAPACPQSPGLNGVEITSYRPNQVRLRVMTENGGLLFLSDRYAPGWKATVNGESAEIYRADLVFRGVCVPAGISEVVFSYRPLPLYVGGFLSILSLIGVVIVVLRKK